MIVQYGPIYSELSACFFFSKQPTGKCLLVLHYIRTATESTYNITLHGYATQGKQIQGSKNMWLVFFPPCSSSSCASSESSPLAHFTIQYFHFLFSILSFLQLFSLYLSFSKSSTIIILRPWLQGSIYPIFLFFLQKKYKILNGLYCRQNVACKPI